jgi:HK97 gp10 family phage protein
MASKGIEKIVSELRQVKKDVDKLIGFETEAIAIQIEGDAKKLAPKNFGKLAQSISHEKISEIQYKVTVNEYYGAYMEFGTGTKVQIPAEFSDIAKSFKGMKVGSFEKGLEAIKVWCRSKGIDERAAYAIFAKVLGAGINPQPFLYPSYIKGKKDYKDNLKKMLINFNKKI